MPCGYKGKDRRKKGGGEYMGKERRKTSSSMSGDDMPGKKKPYKKATDGSRREAATAVRDHLLGPLNG